MVSERVETLSNQRRTRKVQRVHRMRREDDPALEIMTLERQRATVLIFKTKKFKRTPDTEDMMMLTEEALEGEW